MVKRCERCKRDFNLKDFIHHSCVSLPAKNSNDTHSLLADVMEKIKEVSFKIDDHVEVIMVDELRDILSHYFR